ncbi:DUF3302 domain-containing protein [Bremerella sp. JC770]|uniref:DUF3302 domain-containing protein n=1 Tax=Bremerella sp. JC770 TaxID=3232137 RepID=UPI003457AB97
MDFASVFALFVITILFAVIVCAIVALGSLPGKIAQGRNHPHVDAINVASWIGLALGGIFWPIAFIWAFIPMGRSGAAEGAEVDALRKQVAQLQEELATLKNASA